MFQLPRHKLFLTSLLALASTACATAPRRDVHAMFAAEGLGKAQQLVFVNDDKGSRLGEYELGRMPNAPEGQTSLVLGKNEQALWTTLSKSKVEARSSRNWVSVHADITHAKTATVTWKLDLTSAVNFELGGTLEGPGGKMTVETYPEDFEADGVRFGVNGGYIFKDGKVVAAFDFVNLPEKALVSDALRPSDKEMLLATLGVIWLRRLELDGTGRQHPRTPPLGQLPPKPAS